jgi:hypothetical protein
MENENNKNYPFGRKAAAGFVVYNDASVGIGKEMGPGPLSPMNPIGAGVSSPYMPQPNSAARDKARR